MQNINLKTIIESNAHLNYVCDDEMYIEYLEL